MAPEALVAALSEPLVWAAGGASLALILALAMVLAARRMAAATRPLAGELARLGEATRALDLGQARLAGALGEVARAEAAGRAASSQDIERRLEEGQARMSETLHGTATRTARALGELQARLAAIDAAQANIEGLSRNVLSLQDILSNKQARGAFGEIQLADLAAKALAPDAFRLQATLGNGRRVDCLVDLPHPPGPIAIDAKFPLEAYEALVAAETPRARKDAAQALREAVRGHLRDIADRYIVEGETADGALMFLPSEAVYAELHARFGDVVREGFARRVWIVSPTTLMAVLNTMRGVMRDARMRGQAGRVRRELGLLAGDLARLGERVGALDRHVEAVRRDLDGVRLSAEKAGRRAAALTEFEFDAEDGPDGAETPEAERDGRSAFGDGAARAAGARG